MRKSRSIVDVVAVLTACVFLLWGGCSAQRKGPPEAQRESPVAEQSAGPGRAVTLALKFTPGQTTVYNVTTEAEKSVEWHGDTSGKPRSFEGGRTGYHSEMTFEQRVQRVDDQGNATLKITIKAFKYLSRARDSVMVDFDNARPTDQGSPFAKLVGQSYGLEMSPKGEILALIDVEPARQALAGDTPEHQTALRLLDEPIIKNRHEIPVLMALRSDDVSPGQRWSDIKSLDFGMMGTREFERVYTLDALAVDDGDGIAVVGMNAIPSSALAQEQHEAQRTNMFAQMFDSTEDYDGQLKLGLSAGEIVEYTEQLRMQWVAADPAAAETGTSNPAVLRMGATQLYRLDRVK
jgi:hypothetical protein